jgi:hypothetical protein
MCLLNPSLFHFSDFIPHYLVYLMQAYTRLRREKKPRREEKTSQRGEEEEL